MYKQQEPLHRFPEKPKIIGPFRGLILEYYDSIDFLEFNEIYADLTFKHPNFYRSESDKFKTIIYYKYPYDIATLIDKYQHNSNFKISIYNDKLSRALRPDILYIETKNYEQLGGTIKNLQGTIIHKQLAGIQVKFESFKQSAFAYEEIRKTHSVKFTYKSLVPKTNPVSEIEDKKPSLKEKVEEHTESELKKEIQVILNKYNGWTAELKKEFEKAFYKNEVETLEDESCDDSEGDMSVTSSDVLLKLCKMYKNVLKNKQ